MIYFWVILFARRGFVPMLVKNELNLFAINSLIVTLFSLSLKNNGNDFFLVLLRISLMIFQVPLMSSLNFENIV